MFLRITNGIDVIYLPKNKCVSLELEINILEDKDNWRSIGDHLYYYVNPDERHKHLSNVLMVNEKQFIIISNIIKSKKFI
jgi:hypothetical protein